MEPQEQPQQQASDLVVDGRLRRMSNMLRLDPRFGVYGRLKRSELALARRLFPRWRDYLQIARRLRSLRDRLKSAAVWRIILPNPMLLRICQAFGRLKNPPRARVYIDTLDPTGRL